MTLDLLGHGRSDQPADPLVYSMTAFAEQVVALLDHLGAEQAVIGGTSLGANVSLETAVLAPERVAGLLLEMPVLDNALEAGIVAFAPLLFAARFVPLTVSAVRWVTRPVPRGLVPFWVGIGLDTCNQQAAPMAAVVHGIFFGRVAPSSSQRRAIRCRRWSSATRPTRSTRPPTPPCWPPRCRTRASSGPAASWSGASGPSGSTPRRSASRVVLAPPASPGRRTRP